ncbi:hypothetical protein CQA66_06290 [Helicobacter aurati]|uniref:Uncharacterized protein n=1 Tax=Helicobacter aurati TaxID=137778 RepID=A0A3D8J340_9HELI|nr:hypothetical protein [Helicobacter aurati]RDU71565.1 hypothetical protein CQA66_06290 [Helicobacter aurati]
MRFLKFKFRRADIFLIPIAAISIFTLQYYTIQQSANKHQEKLEKKLDTLSKECRAGEQTACNQYTQLLEQALEIELEKQKLSKDSIQPAHN